jgi:hypothetical protein
MSEATKKVAVFSMDHGILNVIETKVSEFVQATKNKIIYRAQMGFKDVLVWRAEDCWDVELPSDCDADFILTVD